MRRRSLLVILALLSGGLTLVLSAPSAQAAFVGKNGWIVFTAVGKGGAAQLWREGDKGLVNITGTTDTPSIRHHDNFSPAWSLAAPVSQPSSNDLPKLCERQTAELAISRSSA